MNYEKKYNEALKWVQKLYPSFEGWVKEDAEHYFPELKENEDERIRKGIIRNLQYLMDRSEGFVKEDLQERIAWLEKQGEQTTDKVEPKFKVGDFITNDYCLGKVIEITNDAYLLDTGQGIPFSCENTHLWTINDAKDGDVLVNSKGNPFIFTGKFTTNYHNPIAYCGIGNEDKFIVCALNWRFHWAEKKEVSPATKEQRDLLIEKMKEAGYAWDAEKKELKKIEPKTLNADKVIEWIRENIPIYGNYVMIDRFKKDFDL